VLGQHYSRSLPVMPCCTMPKSSWRCMGCGAHRHGKGPVAVCPNPAAPHHPTCAPRSWSKNAPTVEWSTLPPASSTGPPRRSQRPYGRRRSAVRSIQRG